MANDKSVLVTGGAGFIGSHLVDNLVLDCWYVRILDNFSSGKKENIAYYKDNSKVEMFKGDVKSLQDVNDATKGVDVVFHYAANPEVRLSTTSPMIQFNENTVATFNLLQAMRKNDVKNLVFASSSSVYGEADNIILGEGNPVKPVSVYGASKAASENFIHAYSKLYGVKAVILRYANVVGPRLRHGIIYDFRQKLLKNPQKLEILGDGSQIRSYIYIEDAIKATMIAYNKTAGRRCEIYNIASRDYITAKEAADTVVEALGLEDVEYLYTSVTHGIGWLGDVKRITMSIDKIRNLGFEPFCNSKEATKKTVLAILKSELESS